LKFNLIDQIDEISTDRKTLRARKNVSLAEEYLADHFPTFPVLPGVMMLEAATQAAGWVLHLQHGFTRSMVVLKEAKNVKYGNFVTPGNALSIEVELLKTTDTGATFKVTGLVNADATKPASITARIELSYFNLADKCPDLAATDAKLIEHHKARWAVLSQGRVVVGGL